jgi:cytosine/adenosine deaminase-related metal-dependent hydrolase
MSGLQGVVYLEVLGLKKQRALERLEKAKRAIHKARTHSDYGPMRVGLSLHAPYSCHPDLLRAGAGWCQAEGVPLCVHVAESRAETEYLLYGRIPFVSQRLGFLINLLAIWLVQVPHLRPVPYLASLGVLDAHPLLIHAIHVDDKDIRMIADAGCAIAHCPRSNIRLSCGRMPLERYLSAGVPIYLGTDSLASSPSLDVRAEAEFAQSLHAHVVDPEKVTDLIHQSFP